MKKDEARYTIRFCSADPRHRTVMEALDAAGRRKAALIVDAIWEYLARHGGAEALVNPPLAPIPSGKVMPVKTSRTRETKPMAEETVTTNQAPSSKPTNRALQEEILIDVESVSSNNETTINAIAEENTDDTQDDSPFDKDMLNAVLGGLSMFGGNE